MVGQLKKMKSRTSVRFLSKAARFFTVGASGLAINYLASMIFSLNSDMWYIHATTLGIIFSISSNFLLNKYWTFEDRDFSPKKTLKNHNDHDVLGSLMTVKSEINDELITSYSDLVFDETILNSLFNFQGDVGLAVDLNWETKLFKSN